MLGALIMLDMFSMNGEWRVLRTLFMYTKLTSIQCAEGDVVEAVGDLPLSSPND